MAIPGGNSTGGNGGGQTDADKRGKRKPKEKPAGPPISGNVWTCAPCLMNQSDESRSPNPGVMKPRLPIRWRHGLAGPQAALVDDGVTVVGLVVLSFFYF